MSSEILFTMENVFDGIVSDFRMLQEAHRKHGDDVPLEFFHLVGSSKRSRPSPPASSPQTAPSPPAISGFDKFWQSNKKLFASKIRQDLQNGVDMNITWDPSEMQPPLLGDLSYGCCSKLPPLPPGPIWFFRNTPLHQALVHKDFETAKLILEAGANPDIYNSHGLTPLHEALFEDRQDAVSFLLNHRAGANAPTIHNKLRLDNGIRADGPAGILPIHIVMWDRNLSMMRLLLENGADCSWLSSDGWNLLDLALLAGDSRAMALLMSCGLQLSPSPATISSLPDERISSRKLFAVSTSRLLVPPTDLYPVYCHIVSQMDYPQNNSSAPSEMILQTAESLIEKWLACLHRIATPKSQESMRNLCNRCSEFQSLLCHYSIKDSYSPRFDFQVHENWQQLEASASNGCSLCNLMADTLDHARTQLKPVEGNSPQAETTRNFHTETKTQETSSSILLHVSDDIEVQCGQFYDRFQLLEQDEDLISNIKVTPDEELLGTGSEQAFFTARAWLGNCRYSPQHSVCRQYPMDLQIAEKGYPLRLVRVGDGLDHIVLIEGVTGLKPYAALSYCRESSGIATQTTQANLEKHMKEIPFEKLPTFFQEAILATRGLGIEYIWIEALCIIQDDSRDWSCHVQRIPEIFSQAELTISSLVANSTSDRLFHPRPTRSLSLVPIEVWRCKKGRGWFKAGINRCYTLSRRWYAEQSFATSGPVHSQVWAFQEHLFSRRILHFGDGMLHWECPCRYATEADPTPVFSVNSKNPLNISGRKEARNTLLQGGSSGLSIFWMKQIERYSKLTLSKPSDRLPAFLGFSRYMEKRLQSTCLGGVMMGENLLQNLCWDVKPSEVEEVVLPTWTWVSQPTGVSFYFAPKPETHEGIIPLAALASTDAKVDENSLQVSGSLTLKGSLYPSHLLKDVSIKGGKGPLSLHPYWDRKSYESRHDYYAFDLLGYNCEKNQAWSSFYLKKSKPAKVLLMLEPTDETLTRFRRLGLGLLAWNGFYPSSELIPFRPMWIDDESRFEHTVTLV
ncbi:hypothetical protein CDV31_010136 [Fusarium ambrosium]|uniref:Heterokaryon incompatibility domain-containing protein n=1 Tax=Fusarium ambrosium TaxID=131363 RepID=A0A428TQ88_9HYPO|nr:hypothetical protein CDV31_010136 [Fusarium ambrosium]